MHKIFNEENKNFSDIEILKQKQNVGFKKEFCENFTSF